MSTPSRRTRSSVVERLVAQPGDFSFVQAVRLLERAAVFAGKALNQSALGQNANHPVARFSPPSREAIRFTMDPSLSFPATEIEKIQGPGFSKHEMHQWEVMIDFLGLTGAMGVMPFHYTELMLQRLKQKDTSLAEFLNLFNHRSASLFFQASSKYRLALEYERCKLHETSKTKNDHHTQALLSLLGLGTKGLQQRQSIRDETLIYFSGLLSQQVKTASGLEQMITYYFGVPVQLEGFVGQWQDLIDDVRTRLPWKNNRKGQNACLGRSAMLGGKGWFSQAKSRIKVGPLGSEQFEKFAPGTGALKALNEMVASYMGPENSFDFVIEVQRDDVPNKIELKKDNPPQLAWNAWLSGKPKTNTQKDELLEILVTSKKLH
ncbi:MAG: type VI secretion system baseplate subunit TssG [Agarilytica sp.]